MFERYTEKARRVIFFARYEALQYGSSMIEPEHLLLGLLREEKNLTTRYFPFSANVTIDSIRREIENRIVVRQKMPQSSEVHLSVSTKQILSFAQDECKHFQTAKIATEHLLLGIIREENSIARDILVEMGMRFQTLRDDLSRQPGKNLAQSQEKKLEATHLQEFTRDLTQDALDGRLDPLIGREKEIERVIEILCRRTKNNPIIIGESGVGKTALIEGLAQRIVEKDVPPFLESKRILALDLTLVVAGTKYRGQFEERLKQIIKELTQFRNAIVFIDEVQTLVGAGSAEGSLDAANILKPALARGEIQCIGATTPSEFRRSIERDRSLERRFQPVKILPPSETDALRIIEGIAQRYEAFHQIRYTAEALEAAVVQTNRYVPERFLPDKAIDALDEAGARAKLRYASDADDGEPNWKETVAGWKRAVAKEEQLLALEIDGLDGIDESFCAVEVTKDDIEEVIARWTGIPIQSLKEDEASKLLNIEGQLRRKIVAQRPAISALSRAIRRSRAGLKSPQRPVGSFLFLGPTGVGKTEVARCLGEVLFGSQRALFRFDMSEYMEKHSVAKLIGAPPGYVGHEEGGQLTEKIRRTPYSVILFDEIEKAHPDIFNLLLQIFEEGCITDSLGNAIDCKNAIFILTSNLGARFIQKRISVGFQATEEIVREKIEEKVLAAVKQTFTPEFLNRLDEVIVFDELSTEDLYEIVDLQLENLNEMLRPRALQTRLTREAKTWLIEKVCADRSYGARPLRRALQKYVEDELSERLIEGKLSEGSVVEVYCDANKLHFRLSTLLSNAETAIAASQT